MPKAEARHSPEMSPGWPAGRKVYVTGPGGNKGCRLRHEATPVSGS
jgi:hypothetical protein